MGREIARLYTARETARALGTYSRLIMALMDLHEIPYYTAGNGMFRLLSRDAVEQLGPHVAQWKGRERLSQYKSKDG